MQNILLQKLGSWPFFLGLEKLLLVTLDFCLRLWCLEEPVRFSSSDSLSSLSLSESDVEEMNHVRI